MTNADLGDRGDHRRGCQLPCRSWRFALFVNDNIQTLLERRGRGNGVSGRRFLRSAMRRPCRSKWPELELGQATWDTHPCVTRGSAPCTHSGDAISQPACAGSERTNKPAAEPCLPVQKNFKPALYDLARPRVLTTSSRGTSRASGHRRPLLRVAVGGHRRRLGRSLGVRLGRRGSATLAAFDGRQHEGGCE